MSDLRGIKCIDLMYQTFQAAWVIYGIIGMRQYMGYSKTAAKKAYMNECRERILVGKNANGTRNIVIL